MILLHLSKVFHSMNDHFCDLIEWCGGGTIQQLDPGLPRRIITDGTCTLKYWIGTYQVDGRDFLPCADMMASCVNYTYGYVITTSRDR